MLYHLAPYLETVWGPFRLLRSHVLLAAAGTLLAAFAVVFLLPSLAGLRREELISALRRFRARRAA